MFHAYHSFVFATALSRLHADLMIVRLKRAQISVSRISAVYSRGSRPNSALSWLTRSAQLPLSTGESVSVSGTLRVALAHPGDSAGSSLFDRLCDLGLDHGQSATLEEALLENRIVIAIEVREENELAEIFEVLHGLAAENILTIDADHRFGIPMSTLRIRRPRRARVSGLPGFGLPAMA